MRVLSPPVLYRMRQRSLQCGNWEVLCSLARRPAEWWVLQEELQAAALQLRFPRWAAGWNADQIRTIGGTQRTGTYLLTGAGLGSMGAAPDAVWVRSVGPEMDCRAELRLLKTLLARRTNLDRPLRSSSGPPDPPGAGVLIVAVGSPLSNARG